MCLLGIIIAFFGSARADDDNPFFGKFKHQMALGAGAGINYGWVLAPMAKFVPFNEFHAQYSVPSDVFYFPARLSLNVSQTMGYGEGYAWDWGDSQYHRQIIYLTKDAALLHGERWLFGTGVGMGFQSHQNDRIGSKLIFTFKWFIGYRFTESFGAEFYFKHFSNGSTTEENNSYAFYGLGMTWNF